MYKITKTRDSPPWFLLCMPPVRGKSERIKYPQYFLQKQNKRANSLLSFLADRCVTNWNLLKAELIRWDKLLTPIREEKELYQLT